ncbi:ribosomal protein S18-alanine N-acetyltransferase [Streptomyces sp. PLAI1-29]|uniref:Ribosomal protein S18-alanine N-acetyltransferase n=1 Tax=Streptomyces zingiberis TaxID=2053010 RepID=A0ABX1C1G6_9ACTN|nr:ribosomal protein S18-alanine N-acetyltransferase [Streptomyces zingiberis]
MAEEPPAGEPPAGGSPAAEAPTTEGPTTEDPAAAGPAVEGTPAAPGDPRRARLVGYGGLAVAGATGDVQTIAVTRSHQGTGLGARLLAELLAAATAFECEEVMLEVRVDNTRAQRLYERFGFQPVGIRRGYYQPGNVDALVMRRTEPGPAADPARDLNPAGAPAAPAGPAHPSPPAGPHPSDQTGASGVPGEPGEPEQGTIIHG